MIYGENADDVCLLIMFGNRKKPGVMDLEVESIVAVYMLTLVANLVFLAPSRTALDQSRLFSGLLSFASTYYSSACYLQK